MNQSMSVFLPLRSGSERVKGKNVRPFLEDGTSLFQLKMRQLIALEDSVDEIVISTDDAEVMEQSQPFLSTKVHLIERPKHLCLSSTRVSDLIDYVPTVVQGDHIFWLHVTAPFVNGSDYQQAIDCYREEVLGGDHDSIMSVNKIQQFIWDDRSKKIVNCDREINPWPSTQDLDPLYEINHAYYISSRHNYLSLGDRIGKDPYLVCMDSIKKVDIDWPEDFDLASRIAQTMKSSGSL
ncbi:MAG: acylneuraminate cytidylyltransferase family protein [Pseudomonadota bacterium]